MTTPKDTERCAAFRAWTEKLPGRMTEAFELTGISHRNLERMVSGHRPPPVQMLPTLARHAREKGWEDVAVALDRAAETTDA
jgi:rubrerythrin